MIDQTRMALIAIAFAALLTACGQAAETPPEAQVNSAAVQAQSETDVAMARAEGDYQAAIARCDAMTGADRDACVDEAVKALNAAKDAAQGFTAPSQSQ